MLEKQLKESDKSDFNLMKEPSLVFVLFIVVLLIVIYACHFGYNGFTALSTNNSDWADFATYISGLISPLIALYVLYFVVMSYRLQKKEFSNASKTMKSQLEIDGLLRRQDSIIQESNRLVQLLIGKLNSRGNIKDEKYKPWFNLPADYEGALRNNESVKTFFEMSVARAKRGDFADHFPDFPDDYNFLVNLIRNIDALCSEIVKIDKSLSEASEVFSTHVSEAFVISTSAEIGDLVSHFRQLGKLDTVNKDILQNF